jgi:uncharacterized protein (UPF0548 family)
MILLRRPPTASISRFLEVQSRLDFTYAGVGSTATSPPAGYTVDHTRAKLGDGDQVFERGAAALARWDHFRLGWVETWPQQPLICPGAVVAVVARPFGLWWLNACRIVYVVDQPGPLRRFGFAYGTLPGHVESGEERFVVEWDQATGEVWYDILAFSRPRHPLARLANSCTRRIQKRFGRDSARALAKATQEASINFRASP